MSQLLLPAVAYVLLNAALATCQAHLSLLRSRVLLQGGFADNLKLLQRYPSVDVHTILVRAAHLR